MKVKIGNGGIYDGESVPVMVILSKQDKINIANMHPDCTKYCVYPSEKWSEEEIKFWMKDK